MPCRTGAREVIEAAKAALYEPVQGTLRLTPIVAFDQVHDGGWVAAAPIYSFRATYKRYGSRAWVRTDGAGHIGTAYCDHVLGIGSDGLDTSDGTRRAARIEDVTDAVEICLSAALGVPSGSSFSWLVDSNTYPLPPPLSRNARRRMLERLYR